MKIREVIDFEDFDLNRLLENVTDITLVPPPKHKPLINLYGQGKTVNNFNPAYFTFGIKLACSHIAIDERNFDFKIAFYLKSHVRTVAVEISSLESDKKEYYSPEVILKPPYSEYHNDVARNFYRYRQMCRVLKSMNRMDPSQRVDTLPISDPASVLDYEPSLLRVHAETTVSESYGYGRDMTKHESKTTWKKFYFLYKDELLTNSALDLFLPQDQVTTEMYETYDFQPLRKDGIRKDIIFDQESTSRALAHLSYYRSQGVFY